MLNPTHSFTQLTNSSCVYMLVAWSAELDAEWHSLDS